ncbi:uncharacterized protein [Nicotiana tomentosiformis]|uniref:uncharacterized protein n=1 Tax=Nicotiana tomentosiformis TaxID=4098 RepID=UPI00051B3680|nr:craniofacial development protein 2-like [Nicotiana tomentosiformis]
MGSWNTGTLTGKSTKLAKVLHKRKVDISCRQETRWVGDKARDVDKFKLWYSSCVGGKNMLGILVDDDLRELVAEVKRVSDRLIAYAPQVVLNEEVKRHFWEDLYEVVHGIPHSLKLFIGEDFNDHIGAAYGGSDDVHGGFGFGVRNEGGTSLLDFVKAFDLVIANSSFPKKEEHFLTFQSSASRTQIDYLFLRKLDRGLCMNCKVIPSENLMTQHRLLVMDLEILRKQRKRVVYGLPRIKWGTLTRVSAQELGDKLLAMGA